MNRVLKGIFAAAAALAVTGTEANATLLTVDFTATVISAFGFPSVITGDTITGSYSYEVPGPADTDASPNRGAYNFASPTEVLQVSVGAYTGTVGLYEIVVNNELTPDSDELTIYAYQSDALSLGIASVNLSESDSALNPFGSDGLPATAPTLGQFTNGTVYYYNTVFATGETRYLTATPTSFTARNAPVPEPMTAMLVGSALFAGAIRKRRSRL